jgi:hypothetical protein
MLASGDRAEDGRALNPALPVRLAFLAFSACAANGCLSASLLLNTPAERYAPATPEAFRAGAAAGQIDTVVVTTENRGAVVSILVTANETVLIAGATLSSMEAAPCTAGVGALGVELDGQKRWDRPIGLKGQHTVTLTFNAVTELLGEPGAVLDVQLAGAAADRCLRFPLGVLDRNAPMNPSSPWAVGGVLRASFPAGSGPYQWLDDELRFSYWFSRAVVGAEAGWALTGCAQACGVTPSYQFPLWLLAEIVPLRVRGFGLGVEVAYGLLPGSRMRPGDPTLLMHGPRLALHFLEITPAVSSRRTQVAAKGVEVSLSYQRAWLGPVEPMVIIGLGLVTF